MKRWMIFQILAVVVTATIGQLCKMQFTDAGLLDLRNIDDTYAMNCGLSFIYGDNPAMEETEEALYNNLVTYEDDYVNETESAPIVIIAHATGNIKNYNSSLGQEIIVDDIIKGDGMEINKSYYIYSVDCFEMNEKGEITYIGLKNLMNQKDSYLAFLEPSVLNGITSEKNFTYSGTFFFNYLNIDNDSKDFIKKPIEDTSYNDIREMEFFAGSERMLNQLNRIKHEIINKYCNSSAIAIL